MIFPAKSDPFQTDGLTIFSKDEAVLNAMPEHLAKAQTIRRGGKKALEELENGTPPIGFTGKCHPLTADAEHKTDAALANNDSESHEEAADAHDEAAKKMASFMKEAGPASSSVNHLRMKGLKATFDHHKKRSSAHRDRAAFLYKQEDDAAQEEKEKEKLKADKKVASKKKK